MMDIDWEGAVDVITGATHRVAVNEEEPSAAAVRPGETRQRVTLLIEGRQRLRPPTRLRLTDMELRVLGSQRGPSWDPMTLVTCELVNPDLPDEVRIGARIRGPLDLETNRHIWTFAPLWQGAAHVEGAAPSLVDAAGERAPLDRVEITLPLDAHVDKGLACEVLTSRHPSTAGALYELAGEIDSSTADLRRVVAYRLE